jgi:multicomponent Na+:H+ antiporter subunit E
MFTWHVLLTLAWAAVNGEFSVVNLLVGFALSYVVIAVLERAEITGPGYTSRVPVVIRFAGFFLWELFMANIRVAQEVLRPRVTIRPGVVAVPLTVTTDLEITLLSCLITLTPGTLALDVSDDRSTLYVHALDVMDPEAFRRSIVDGFERRVLELLR